MVPLYLNKRALFLPRWKAIQRKSLKDIPTLDRCKTQCRIDAITQTRRLGQKEEKI